jgi:hypothetical protein
MKARYIANYEAQRDEYLATKDDFKYMEGKAKDYFNGLNQTQKSNVANTFNNWGAATAGQKADALLAAVALLFVAVGYLIRLQLKDQG